MYTALNYLGYQTKSCNSSYSDVMEYVLRLFKNCDNMDPTAIFLKAEAIPAPELNIIIGSIQIMLSPEVPLKKGDSLLLRVGIYAQNMKCLKAKKAAYMMEWKEEFSIELDSGDQSLSVEVWLKPNSGPENLIGTVSRSVKSFPCTGDRTYEIIPGLDSSSETPFVGFISFIGYYNVYKLDQYNKLSVISQHIQICCVCFEHHMQSVEKISYDGTLINPRRLYDFGHLRIFPAEVVTFLHQYALQNKLTPYENIACCFLVLNQHFIKNRNVKLSAVYVFLRELALLGKCPQKKVLLELKNSVKRDVLLSAKKCSRLLCSLQVDSVDDKKGERLGIILKFLCLAQKYFYEGAIAAAIKIVQKETCFPERLPLSLSELSEELSSAKNCEFTGFLNKYFQNLVKIDSIFLLEWEFTYSSFMFKHIDDEMTELLSLLVQIVKNDLETYTKELHKFIQLYYFLDEFVSYLNLSYALHTQPKMIVDQLNIFNFQQLLGGKVFRAYFKTVEDEDVISWLTNHKDNSDLPLSAYCEKLLDEWALFFYNNKNSNHEPLMIALVEVFCEKMISFCQFLRKNFKKEMDLLQEEDWMQSKSLIKQMRLDPRFKFWSARMDTLANWTSLVLCRIFRDFGTLVNFNFKRHIKDLMLNMWLYPDSHSNIIAKVERKIDMYIDPEKKLQSSKTSILARIFGKIMGF